MPFPVSRFDFRSFRGAAVATALLMAPALAHAETAPFANYAGNWSGNGTITIAEGGTERIRCRGTYSVDGAATTCIRSCAAPATATSSN